MMITMDSDGTCKRHSGPVPAHLREVAAHEFDDCKLVLSGRLYETRLLEQPLPLPFGSRLLEAPVVWSWDRSEPLETTDLDRLLALLIVQAKPPSAPTPLQLEIDAPSRDAQTDDDSDSAAELSEEEDEEPLSESESEGSVDDLECDAVI